MSVNRKRKTSAKQAEANRRNGRKSKGPRTPQGKLRVKLNAFKHGLHADPLVQGMLQIGENPQAYYRLQAELYVSLCPQNPHQRLQVEDIGRLRWEKLGLERARQGRIVAKLQKLE